MFKHLALIMNLINSGPLMFFERYLYFKSPYVIAP